MNKFLEKDGNPVGQVHIGFINGKDSTSAEIEILPSDDISHKYILEAIHKGTTLRAASTNDRCSVVSVSGSVIKTDKTIRSFNKEYLMKGEIIIIDDTTG